MVILAGKGKDFLLKGEDNMEYLPLILVFVLVAVIVLGAVLVSKLRYEAMDHKDKVRALSALLLMLPILIGLATAEFLQTIEPQHSTYVAVKVEEKR
jgi:phosphatidylserine synthase